MKTIFGKVNADLIEFYTELAILEQEMQVIES